MRGLSYLKHIIFMDEPVETAINERFGNIEQLYMQLFELHLKVYRLTRQAADEYDHWRSDFHERVYQELEPEKDAEFLALMDEFKKIENKLEQCELLGSEAIKDTGLDFDDIMVRKKRKDFHQYLARHGNDYPNLKEWVENLNR